MIVSENDLNRREFPRITVKKDVVVVGGGLAGICAAIAAARAGVQTALVTDRPVLGGNASSEIRVGPLGADQSPWHRYACETGIIEEITMRVLKRATASGLWRWLYFDDTYFDMTYAEPNLEVFLNTTVTMAYKKDNTRITAVEGVQLRSEKTVVFEGKEFIDCSGDGVVGFLAGADYRIGREAKSEFGETHAPTIADRCTMGATLLFSTIDRGHPVGYQAPPWALNARELSTITNPDHAVAREFYRMPNGTFYGLWWAEYGGEIDSIRDDDAVMRHTREVVYGLWDYIKNSGKFRDVANLEIDWVGYLPGKRESRRLIGEYICTANDFMTQKDFSDAIGHAGWPIDIHPPKGYADPLPACTHDWLPGITDIPFRALYSRTIENLLFAGRNVSVSHEGLGAVRVQRTTALMGQAAGTAAALCVAKKIAPKEIYRGHVPELQKTLMRNDQSITGFRLIEEDDMSRAAQVSASSVRVMELGTGAEWHNLDKPLGIVIPVMTERLDTVSFYFKPIEAVDVEYEVFACDKPQNYRLQNKIASGQVRCEQEGWHDVTINASVGGGRKAIVVLKRAKNVLVKYAVTRMMGVLGISVDADVNMGFNTPFGDLGYIPCFKVAPAQDVYAPANIHNGYIRPLGVPNVWASGPMRRGHAEWIVYRFNKEALISSIDLVFNTNLNIRWAGRHSIFEELVRDYEVQAITGNGYASIIVANDNCLRFQRHTFAPIAAQGVRLLIHTTWGLNHAEVFDMRVY